MEATGRLKQNVKRNTCEITGAKVIYRCGNSKPLILSKCFVLLTNTKK